MKSKSVGSLQSRLPVQLPAVFTGLACRDSITPLTQKVSIHTELTKFPELRIRLLASIPSKKPRVKPLRWQMQPDSEASHPLSTRNQPLILPKLKPHFLRLPTTERASIPS